MKIALVILCFALTGCGQAFHPEPVRYQIIPQGGDNGGAWRLDTTTGEMKSCAVYSPNLMGPVCYTAAQK